MPRTRRYLMLDEGGATPAPPEPPAWWEVEGQTCVAAYQPKGAASLAASYVNLANPGTNDAMAGWSGPSWSEALGWIGKGVADISCAILVDLPFAMATTMVVRAVLPHNAKAAFYGNPAAPVIETIEGGLIFRHQTSLIGVVHTPYDTTQDAVYAIAGTLCYGNGSYLTTAPQAAFAPTTGHVYILSESNTGASVAALALYESSLSAAQIAALSTNMAAL